MNTKKGVIEVQFNWIFVLIVGFVILTLFTTIIVKQKNVSEATTDRLILKNLDAVWSGSEVSTGTVNTVKIPETKIEFGCNEYYIGKNKRLLTTMNVFAPSVLEGDKIISYTLDWSIPYKVTNFVYLTNPETRYIFIAESGNDFAKKVFEMIPEGINKDMYEQIEDVQDKHDDIVRIIFFEPVDLQSITPDNLKRTKKISALKVDGSEDLGKIEFYIYIPENKNFLLKGESCYLREPTLLGAIFTDDNEVYDCSMGNAFKKLNMASKVYQEKISVLSDHDNIICKRYYSDTDDMTTILGQSIIFSQTSVEQISTAATNLEAQNKRLQRSSCPIIY